MSLPWIRLDTTIADHPKMLALTGAKKHRAALGYILSIAYSGRHELDGFVPSGTLPVIHITPADAASLVEVGLWHECDGGWRINSWDEFQVSSEETQRRRKRAQDMAMKRWHPDVMPQAMPVAMPSALREQGVHAIHVRTDVRTNERRGTGRSETTGAIHRAEDKR